MQCRHERLEGTSSDVAPILWQYGALSRLDRGEKIDKLLHGGYSTISLGYAGLYECVKYGSEEELNEIHRKASREGADVVDILIDFIHIRLKSMSSVNPKFYAEIMRYKKVADFLKTNHDSRRKEGNAFIKRGQREGYIRKDVDFELLGAIFDRTIQAVLDDELFNEYSLKRIFRNIIFVTIRGISTQKGIEKMDRLLEKNPL
ncbi:MAG: anaerobic ribonucleoside-triphosphate reductase [Prevotella sp.]